MKVWLLGVLLLVSTAHADTFALRDVPSTTTRPAVVTRTRDCKSNRVSQLRTLTATIAGREVEVYRDCSAIPAMTSLAIRIDEHWFVADGFTIADIAATMSDNSFGIHRVSESLTRGSFSDGAPAIVYRAITRHDSVRSCGGDDCVDEVVESNKVDNFLVCRVVSDTVMCGRIQYVCPSSGCGSPKFESGLLTVLEQHVYAPVAGK